MAGSGRDAAHRRRGPEGIGRRRLRMNDDLMTLGIVGGVAIVGMRIVHVPVLGVHIVALRVVLLLRRSGSGDGERQRRRPDRRHG